MPGSSQSTGILIIQHGDFPFDFIEKERQTYERIENILGRLSDESRKLDHSPEKDPHAADTRKLADTLRSAGYDVEIGYLDFATPTIASAIEALEAKGHKKVVFANTPGLMMRSSHSLIDVPKVLKEIQAAKPGMEMLYVRPGAPLQLISRALTRKINGALGMAQAGSLAMIKTANPGTGVVLIAHGDVPLDFVVKDTGIMQETEHSAHNWSEQVKGWPRSEENDPGYTDTLVLKTMLRESFWPVPIEVGFLEFAEPGVGDAFEKLIKSGAKRIICLGGTGFFDRSSHTLLDIPAAIEHLKKNHPGVDVSYVYPDIDLVLGDLVQAIAFKIEEALRTGEIKVNML